MKQGKECQLQANHITETIEEKRKDSDLLVLWQQVLVGLIDTMGKDALNKWLRDTTLTSYNGQEAVIHCPSDHIAEWLGKRLHMRITDAFTAVVGQQVNLSYATA